MSAKRTQLYDLHIESGAKLIDFGGWEMPVSYGSQIEEHKAVRTNVGMFDVSHMLRIDLSGTRIVDFLRKLLSNDILKISESPGKALYSCMLNEEGGIIDDLITYYVDNGDWRLVVNAGCADSDLEWISKQARAFEVQVTSRRDLAMIAIQGPLSQETLSKALPEDVDLSVIKPFSCKQVGEFFLGRTGYTGEDGFEISAKPDLIINLWKRLVSLGVQPCGLGARDTLRLEAGMNLYGSDMDTSTQPSESGLQWTVSLKDEERDFIGRSALDDSRKKSFLGIRLLGRGVMRSHMKVRTSDGAEGEITSGTMSPSLGYSIGFVRMPFGTEPNQKVEVDIRGKWHEAELVKLPFVKNGKALV
ncbi:glycine cleavage system aminomethyltransferase GcvT [Taylorella equigenitalis]|uniref:glycine cleavage system aminomethyltransferase GcvT n=1 Tax=Taylorella equigenitalis TaxID=29575 RepID=UPI00040F604B|nr:glycine cleavage system aminomethyltransferase GcvT [Taylorella equigenitalis]ASY37395.1 glycine cleavage system protein T [Taylorella equigenitalis]ASY41819.1 glycine cleavage system protein T [Taylorella equigenitalis]KGK33371.1 glycine cleavage system protein T [Taylorella equigenitalis]RBA25885.1 glycine cleavage system aminomethyltransferase GcvT [Taylorella equigenitalis]WDU46685.1 glycine cleavage system aminomethyltransferase GcvT [Taylorella equigenitalis]